MSLLWSNFPHCLSSVGKCVSKVAEKENSKHLIVGVKAFQVGPGVDAINQKNGLLNSLPTSHY